MTQGRILRFLSRISIRLLAFNLLLVFLPAAGVLLLDTYERHLLEAQERTMSQEGRLLAAALEATGRLDGADARSILLHLGMRHIARLRVVDEDGAVIADSSTLGPRREPDAPPVETTTSSDRERPLYRIFSLPVRAARLLTSQNPPDITSSRPFDELPGTAVQQALEGRYGASTLIRPTNGRDMVELHIAIPIRIDGAVIGAALVSQSTWRVMNTLYAVRLDVARVVLISLVVAGALSLLLGLTIARPLTRLRQRSEEILDRRGRLMGRFEAGDRKDEIGDLERALAVLTQRLEDHLSATESLASDLSHEFKNPLAAIRATTEVALDENDPGIRHRMLENIQADVARLERLLTGAQEISRIEMQVEREDRDQVPLVALLEGVREAFRRRRQDQGPAIELSLPEHEIRIWASADRLLQVFENLLANAVSFTPTGRRVMVSLKAPDDWAEVIISDDGPGIPAEHLDRIFSRFFSYRPGTDPSQARISDQLPTAAADTPSRAASSRLETLTSAPKAGKRGLGHMGLGLPIVKAIVEGYGGTVTASNLVQGGARFVVRLPTS